MKSNVKSFLLGVVMTVIVSGVLTAFAATIDVEIGGIRIFWDGEEKTLTNVNGEKVEPMIYNGTTYVPVRAMSELMGKTVEWDETTTTVYVGGKPEGVAAATVNGTEITDVDVNYQIYAEASMYAQGKGMTLEEIDGFDWNQTENGFPISKSIKEDAVDNAINEAVVIQKGAEKGIVLEDSEKKAIAEQVENLEETYGEDGLVLRTRTMAIPSAMQYKKMYENATVMQKIAEDISNNPDAYYPEDISILNHYVQPDGASVKHILIQADDTNRAEKKKEAESILKRVQSGEDFDALVAEFNEDPGAGTTGYTFGPGEMVKEFEDAAFSLGIGSTCGIVETSYGFHIIKRIPGMYELRAYWRAEMGNAINVVEDVVSNLDVNAVMADVVAATKELEN